MRGILSELGDMLTYRRPMGSDTETAFVDRWIKPLPGAYVDVYGNWHVTIGNNHAKILWSCHTDTVHTLDGRQTIAFNARTGLATLSKQSIREGSNCLGADCTVGVWIMVNMIRRGVEGHYVFHYGEERGGRGSSDIAAHCAPWLATFEYAIAFDRRGYRSIIVEQAGYPTASELFALSLEEELKRSKMAYESDRWGFFTDTANYGPHISECTNLSVGYQHEHTTHEQLDVNHAERLLDAVCVVDQSALISDRIPAVDTYGWGSWAGESIGSPYVFDEETDEHDTDEAGTCELCGRYSMSVDRSGTCFLCRHATNQPQYLDPVYEEVQRELTQLFKQRQGK